jgi:hypothetical protein
VNFGRLALAGRGFFDIGRAEARAERKIEVRSQRSAVGSWGFSVQGPEFEVQSRGLARGGDGKQSRLRWITPSYGELRWKTFFRRRAGSGHSGWEGQSE